MLRLALCFFLFLMATSSFAKEGHAEGNGGNGIVCYTPLSDVISSVRLLDLYEGTRFLGLEIPQSQEPVDTQLSNAVQRLGITEPFLTHFNDELSWVRHHLRNIQSDEILTPVDDVFPATIKRGCSYQLIANYSTDDFIMLDSRLFIRLSNTDRAALILHETLYRLARDFRDATNSQKIRTLIANIFATPMRQRVVHQLIEDAVYPLQAPTERAIRLSRNSSGPIVLEAEVNQDVEAFYSIRTSNASYSETVITPAAKLNTGAVAGKLVQQHELFASSGSVAFKRSRNNIYVDLNSWISHLHPLDPDAFGVKFRLRQAGKIIPGSEITLGARVIEFKASPVRLSYRLR